MCPTVNPLRLGSSGFVAIDDNFAAQVAAFGDRLRDCVKRYGHQGRACSRLAHGDGPRSRAGILDDGRDLRGARLPHPEKNVVSGGGPALAQRGIRISCSDKGDLHHGFSRLARGGRSARTTWLKFAKTATRGHSSPHATVAWWRPLAARPIAADADPRPDNRHFSTCRNPPHRPHELGGGAKQPGFNAALTGAASDHFRQRLAPLLGQRVGGLEAAALLLNQRLTFKVLEQCID